MLASGVERELRYNQSSRSQSHTVYPRMKFRSGQGIDLSLALSVDGGQDGASRRRDCTSDVTLPLFDLHFAKVDLAQAGPPTPDPSASMSRVLRVLVATPGSVVLRHSPGWPQPWRSSCLSCQSAGIIGLVTTPDSIIYFQMQK